MMYHHHHQVLMTMDMKVFLKAVLVLIMMGWRNVAAVIVVMMVKPGQGDDGDGHDDVFQGCHDGVV